MTDERGVTAAHRTWRPPVWSRLALIGGQGAVVAVTAWLVWVTLSSNHLKGQVAVVVAAPLWGVLAFRVWTASATLTRDALVIRNVLFTEEVALADITQVAFGGRRTVLKVTERRPASAVVAAPAVPGRRRDPGERHTVAAIRVGLMAAVRGARCGADEAAAHIAAAAGLPAPPVRQAGAWREVSLILWPAGVAMLVLGAALAATGRPGEDALGGWLGSAGAMSVALSVIAGLGRFFARRRT